LGEAVRGRQRLSRRFVFAWFAWFTVHPNCSFQVKRNSSSSDFNRPAVGWRGFAPQFFFFKCQSGQELTHPFTNCPDCGNPVEKGALFCPICFARIATSGLWRRLADFIQNGAMPGPHVLSAREAMTIKTMNKDATAREHHSLAEAPLGLQKASEKTAFPP